MAAKLLRNKHKKNLESKREGAHHRQGIVDKISSRFHIRNHGSQRAVGGNTQSAERNGLSTKNPISSKTILHK